MCSVSLVAGTLSLIAMKTDPELLRSYIEDSSEEAFTELVRRHVNLVYSVALRKLGGDAALAQDATQAVFTALAAKAATLGHIRHVAGWLYGTSRHTAAHAARAESRRQARERKAETMHEILGSGESSELAAMPPEMLDEIMETLDATDREAILLRFFEGQSFLAVGVALRVSEDAARMRVARALETIRARFAKQGITSSAAAIGAALANQVIAAPPAFAASVSSAALAGTAALAAPATKLGLLAFMTTTKTSTWLAAAVALAALGIYGRRQGLEAASAARLELARNREKISALDAEDQRLSVANDDLRTKLKARTQSAASAQSTAAAKAAQPPWELMRTITRDKLANVNLTPFDNKTGKLSEGFADIFALSQQERDSLERAVADAHRGLALLMVKNATANTIDGKVTLTVRPFDEGAEVRTRLLETFANTLGPDRFEVLDANIRNGTDLNQAFGGFGVGGVAGTIIRVPTGDDSGSQFRVSLRIATTAGGSSSATNVDAPNAAALPDSLRWLNTLVPDLGNLPVSMPDSRANIAPGPGALPKP